MITIAPFSPRFQQQVVDLIVPIQREEFGIQVTVDDQPDLLAIPSFYQSQSGGFWLALDGQKVVGTIGLRDIGNRQGALRKMFVKATRRGGEHRVAARLLTHLIDASRVKGISEIFLGTTERFVAAHRFYEKNGFDLVLVSELPDAFPRMAVDTRFYRLQLNR